MKLSEFHEGIARYKRLLMVIVGVTGIALAVWAAAVVVFSAQLDRVGTQVFGAKDAPTLRAITGFLVVIVMFATSAFVQRVADKDHRLCCPNCGVFLGKASTRFIVIATKNCTSCGKQVIDQLDVPA